MSLGEEQGHPPSHIGHAVAMALWDSFDEVMSPQIVGHPSGCIGFEWQPQCLSDPRAHAGVAEALGSGQEEHHAVNRAKRRGSAAVADTG